MAEWIARRGVAQTVGRAVGAVIAARPESPLRCLAALLAEGPLAPPQTDTAPSEPAVAYLQRHGLPSAINAAVEAVAADRPQSPERALSAHFRAQYACAAITAPVLAGERAARGALGDMEWDAREEMRRLHPMLRCRHTWCKARMRLEVCDRSSCYICSAEIVEGDICYDCCTQICICCQHVPIAWGAGPLLGTEAAQRRDLELLRRADLVVPVLKGRCERRGAALRAEEAAAAEPLARLALQGAERRVLAAAVCAALCGAQPAAAVALGRAAAAVGLTPGEVLCPRAAAPPQWAERAALRRQEAEQREALARGALHAEQHLDCLGLAAYHSLLAPPSAPGGSPTAQFGPWELLLGLPAAEARRREQLSAVVMKSLELIAALVDEPAARRAVEAGSVLEIAFHPAFVKDDSALRHAVAAWHFTPGVLVNGTAHIDVGECSAHSRLLAAEETVAREPFIRLSLEAAQRRGLAAAACVVSAVRAADTAASRFTPGELLAGLPEAEQEVRTELQRRLRKEQSAAAEPLGRRRLELAERRALAASVAQVFPASPEGVMASVRVAGMAGILHKELLLCLPEAEAQGREQLAAEWRRVPRAWQLRAQALQELPATEGDERRERRLLAAHERQCRELLCATLLAAAPPGAPEGGALSRFFTLLAADAGLGGALPAELPALGRLAVAETVEHRDAALAELREALARAPVASLQSGFAAAAAAELPPVREREQGPDASPLAGTGAELERRTAAAAADGFAARQQQGALDVIAATKAEPDAVRRRWEGLRPAYTQETISEWRVAKAPEGSPLEERARSYSAALELVMKSIARGTPREADCRAVDFILDLPERLHAADPSTKDWFTNTHVTTTEVWSVNSNVRIPHCSGFWQRRDTGLLGMLCDVLGRVAKQVQWAADKRLWEAPEQIQPLVARAKQGEGLSKEQLQQLVGDAELNVQSLRALLEWDTATALAMTVAGFLYCANLPWNRFKDKVFDNKGELLEGYLGPLQGKKNCDCQLFAIWNKALREYTDPEWPHKVSAEAMESHRRILEVFAPMSYLLTELIHSLSAAGPAPIVSRGIRVRISEMFTTGTAVPLAQFTSTSADDRASLSFAGAAGTWMKMQVVSAGSVGWCSPYPGERELLLPPGTMTEVGFKFGGTLLMLLESRRDLVFLCEWSDRERDVRETVEQRCRTLKENTMLFEDFCARFVEPRCDIYNGDEEQADKTDRLLFDIFKDFLSHPDVHVIVLVGGGGIGKSSSLVALMREASLAADWVPFFDGLHQIEGLLDLPGSHAVQDCYLEHLKQRALQCRDPDAALEHFQRRRVFHALDSLDETQGTLPTAPLLQSMGLEAGPRSKVGISTRPEHLKQQGVAMRNLHGGPVWRVELKGFGEAQANAFAERSASQWAASAGRRGKAPGREQCDAADCASAARRARAAIAALRAADTKLAQTPFVIKMVVELAIADRQHFALCNAELKWRLVSEWVQLQVEQATPRFSKLATSELQVCSQSARVAIAIGVLLVLTGEWQGILARFADVLRRPGLITEPLAAPRDAGAAAPRRRSSRAAPEYADRLYFSPPLGHPERSALAAHLTDLLAGVPPQRVRDLLGTLPLRCEHLDSDSGLFSFRHKIVAEWVIALWFAVQCAAPSGAPSSCPAAVRRFASPHCWDSQELVIAQLGADGGLLRCAAQLAGSRRQSVAAEGEMPQRLRRMAAVKNTRDPIPPLPSRDWMRREFAPKAVALYDVTRSGVLSRRQLGTVLSVGILGGADRPLSDAEWAAERRVMQSECSPLEPGEPPSVLQAVRMAGGAADAAASELSAEQVGQWLWGLLDWLAGPTTRILGDERGNYSDYPALRLGTLQWGRPVTGLGPQLGRGLLRLWEAAQGAERPWGLDRAVAQLLQRVMRRSAERCRRAERARAARLPAARLAALRPAACSEGLPPDGALPLQLLVNAVANGLPLCHGAAAESAPAFRAAAAACWAAGAAGAEGERMLLRQCWAGREGDWAAPARLLSFPAELLRIERVGALCAELEGGAAEFALGGRDHEGFIRALCPSAAQLEQLLGAARRGGALRRVRAVYSPRLAGAAEAGALCHLIAECPTVREASVECSPLPPAAPRRLAAALAPRGGDGLTGSALDAEERVAGAAEKLRQGETGLRMNFVPLSAAQLAELCAAVRNAQQCERLQMFCIFSLPEADWEQVAQLVRDCPSIAHVDMCGAAASQRVCAEITRILSRRKGWRFECTWGKQGHGYRGEFVTELEDSLRHHGEPSWLNPDPDDDPPDPGEK